MEDSLQVIESPEGGLVVQWDPKDPKYQFLNGLTEEQVNSILKQAILEALGDNNES
jgi:hypothetical protein